MNSQKSLQYQELDRWHNDVQIWWFFTVVIMLWSNSRIDCNFQQSSQYILNLNLAGQAETFSLELTSLLVTGHWYMNYIWAVVVCSNMAVCTGSVEAEKCFSHWIPRNAMPVSWEYVPIIYQNGILIRAVLFPRVVKAITPHFLFAFQSGSTVWKYYMH